jgi:hypothetical protein
MKPKIFAAKYENKGLGWTLLVFGVICITGTFTAANISSGTWIINLIVGLPSAALGVYFIRGQGKSPKRLAKEKSTSDKLENSIQATILSLESAHGGRAFVKYRKLEGLLRETKSPEYLVRFEEILRELKFDKTKVASTRIGVIPSSRNFMTAGTPIEVFNDWIIYGEQAFDTDSSTRGEVHIEGSIQIDGKGNKQDLRSASVMFLSSSWSKTFQIDLQSTAEARRIVGQLSAVSDSRKPVGVTSADISIMIETILNNTGQPAAEKVAQLSDLRYQRLLTDQEFESAKAKVLGI